MTTPEFAAADEAGTDRKKLVLVGGLVAALLAGGGGYMLLSGGGGDDVALGVPPVRKPAAVKGTPAKAAKLAAKPAAKVPAATTVRLGRDPFLALYVQPVAAPEGSTTTSGGTTTPTTVGTPTGGSSTDGSATPTGTSAPYALTLVSITGAANEDKVFTFSVGGTKKSVVAAQKFGKYSELVTLNFIKNSKGAPVAALVQVGDDDPVVIRIGEKLSVL